MSKKSSSADVKTPVQRGPQPAPGNRPVPLAPEQQQQVGGGGGPGGGLPKGFW